MRSRSRPSGRPLDPAIDVAVLDATRRLLVEVGYAGLTYALVAERARSSRPALYRRWPSKAHLVYDAIFPSTSDEPPPDDPSFRSHLRATIGRIDASYRRPEAREAVPFLLAEIRDPQRRSSIVDDLLAQAHHDFAARVAQAVLAGELTAGTRADLLLETVHAAALHHALAHDAYDPTFADRLATLVVEGARSHPSPAERQPEVRPERIATTMRDRTLTTRDGTRIVYRTGGRGGPALVFVHGWCSNLTHWSAQLQHFASSHRVLAADRRGHGRSAAPARGYTAAQHAQDLLQIVERERLRDIVLIAHAGGGPTAVHFADRHPGLVRGMVLVDSNISGRTTLGRPHSVDRSPLGRLVDQLTGPDAPARFEAMYRGFFGPLAGAAGDAAVRDATQVPLRVARADLASLAADSEGAARRFQRPVLWLTAETPDVRAIRALFADVHFGVVAGSGHFPHLEVPAQVNAMIERHLTLIEARSAVP